MTEPNWEARARWLAKKVMGGIREGWDADGRAYQYVQIGFRLPIALWRPNQDIGQAIEVVEALLAMTMERDGEKWCWAIEMGGASVSFSLDGFSRMAPYYWCQIEDNPVYVARDEEEGFVDFHPVNSHYIGSEPSLARAIVLAACEATGYEEV